MSTDPSVLRKWLPNVIQSLDPWMSESDIDRGTRWNMEISGQLEQAKIGIICLTPENLTAPWINFEAGALAKLGNSRVCTYLHDLAAQSVEFPLAQFQATKAEKEDTKKMLLDINKTLNDEGLPVEQLKDVFEKWWPELREALTHITQTPTAALPPQRSTQDVLEEIVSTIRENSHTQSTILTEVTIVRNALLTNREESYPWQEARRYWARQGNAVIQPLPGAIVGASEPPLALRAAYPEAQTGNKEPGK